MTDELKKALLEAKTEEERKNVAKKFEDEIRELSDEELDSVSGGFYCPPPCPF